MNNNLQCTLPEGHNVQDGKSQVNNMQLAKIEDKRGTDGKTPTTFPNFGELPSEIRRMIWSMVEQEPRCIRQRTRLVLVSRSQWENQGRRSYLETYYHFSILPVLHACAESLQLGIEKPAHIHHPTYRICNAEGELDDQDDRIIMCSDLDKIRFALVGILRCGILL
ncbi:hypothetical protein PVAG01_02246 [Phlyctema vagabunda]|uniref:2EXR domain-containing protein n=1 Tax=Phlyctema vagabunda TaxID=108571 RepID=A0ABR4PQ02_9HELO